MKTQRLVVLDGMRGLAAVSVLSSHLGFEFFGVQLLNGALAVDFFFVLSGFVLSRAHRAQLNGGALTVGEFMTLRVIRVWPMLVLGTLVGAACVPWQHQFFSPHGAAAALTVALSFFALPLPHPNNFWWVNASFWSLSAELVINLIYAALFALRMRLRFPLATAAFVALFVLEVARHGTANLALTSLSSIPSAIARAGASYFIGVLIERAPPPPASLRGMPSWIPPVALLLLLVPSFGAAPPAGYALLCVLLLFPLLVLLGAHVAQQDRGGTLSALGDASFPLYAIHAPLVAAAGHLFPIRTTAAAFALVAALLVALPIVSVWIARRVEAPVRRRLAARLRGRRPAPARSG